MQVADIDNNISSNEPLRNKIKKIVKKWILATTAHGLPSIFRTEQMYLKIIWTVVFLASLCGCVYIVVRYTRQYFDYEKNVNVNIITEMPSDFPAVTLCNLNSFYMPRAKQLIVANLAAMNYSYLLDLQELPMELSAIEVKKTALTLVKTAIETNTTMTTVEREQLGFTIEDMLVTCFYNGNKCSAKDFAYLKSYEHTNCYTFNSFGKSNETKRMGNAGSSSSFELELYVGEQSGELFIQKRGVYVIVHNQTVSPLLDTEGLDVANSFETSLGVKRTFVTNLASPYSSCIEDVTSSTAYNSVLYKAIFDALNQKRYRQKYCYKLCYQLLVVQKCDCYDPSVANPFPISNGTKTVPCGSIRLVICMFNIKKEFQSSGISTTCSKACPVECSFVYYDLVQATATYPTNFYSNWLSLQNNVKLKFNGSNTASYSSSLLKLNVFYASMDYTSITQTPALTWDTLLGNIGGMLGLFIGISILSTIELFELLFEIIRITWNHNKLHKSFS